MGSRIITSDYWYYITVTYTKKEGSEVIKNDYEGDDSEIKNIIDAYNIRCPRRQSDSK